MTPGKLVFVKSSISEVTIRCTTDHFVRYLLNERILEISKIVYCKVIFAF